MKDYRTWWRHGFYITEELMDEVYLIAEDSKYFKHYHLPGNANEDQDDCMMEQLWAIVEGLA